MVRQRERFSYGCDYCCGAPCLQFFSQDFGHHTCVLFVEVTHRFVHEDEIERLAECPYECHALLLSERHACGRRIASVGYAHRFHPPRQLCIGSISRKGVFQTDVLKSGQLGEEAQFLKQDAQRGAPLCRPGCVLRNRCGIRTRSCTAMTFPCLRRLLSARSRPV